MIFGTGLLQPDSYTSMLMPSFKFPDAKHIPWHRIANGTDVTVETKDGKLTPAKVISKTNDKVTLKTSDNEIDYNRKDFGFTWKLWYGKPSDKERKNDPWRT